jgi:SAM-dependent methyltransferase
VHHPINHAEHTAHSVTALASWLATPAGQYVLAWEQAAIDGLVADLFGFHALQIGMLELNALRANRMPHQWKAAICPGLHLPHDGVFEAEDLPYPNQSLDLIVLAHVLEFSPDPHQVLREVERVLVPEGRVIVVGFNPMSLWGARQRLLRYVRRPYLPKEGHFISRHRLKDWLKLLSFENARGQFGCYIPSVRTDKWINRWQWIDPIGERWWPVAGSVYAHTAVKRVRGMRMIGPIRKGVLRPVPAAVPATHSSARREHDDVATG